MGRHNRRPGQANWRVLAYLRPMYRLHMWRGSGPEPLPADRCNRMAKLIRGLPAAVLKQEVPWVKAVGHFACYNECFSDQLSPESELARDYIYPKPSLRREKGPDSVTR